MAQPVSPPPGEPSSVHVRAVAVLVVVVCLFGTLLGRLWYLQGVESKAPQLRTAVGEGLQTIYLPAPRGEIFDRNGQLLAGNRVQGPAVITEMDSTTLVLPGHTATVHPSGSLLIRPTEG